MINAVHMLMYSENPSADRAFLRDVLGYPYVDTGDDWLIFKLPPAELGVHPADAGGRTDMYFMCDDLEATLAELTAKGVEIASPVSKRDYGVETTIRLPGGGQVGLYQAFHQTAYDL
ncbi:MAG TPA: extradiol dioxygenase [Micromonosporaceae bacterium]|nr:extradiol dioxygenase [Micromonosporaceae bacterium]